MANMLARSHQLDQLTGSQKVAILCMVLGSEAASMITQKLAPEEVEQISFEIARMDRVSHEATEAVLSEWLAIRNSHQAKDGRGDRIRTCDPLLPKQMRYQPAPLPDASDAG